ncbi:MAG: preprotein translocase subunit SecE [Candidatus Gracilibacteria bacterium]|nr:preprotein translocase subunit SecE [Candidatus Gracilibacteria bacterium]
MIQFFKASFRELQHVVWPTRQETKNYFMIVLIVLVLFGIYLLVFSTAFSEGILYLRKIVSA